MNYDQNKIILIDCDGVMLNWISGFIVWMNDLGYNLIDDGHAHYSVADKFNIDSDEASGLELKHNFSTNMSKLPPISGAQYYMNLLHQIEGYKFHVITSCSADKVIQRMRKNNIKRYFGTEMFVDISILDLGETKEKYLSKYDGLGNYWIEDNVLNANHGLDFGLKPLFFKQDHNIRDRHLLNSTIPQFETWKEIYEEIVS